MIHNFLRFVYAKKFPELESLIMQPFVYAKVVSRVEMAFVSDLYPRINANSSSTISSPVIWSSLSRSP